MVKHSQLGFDRPVRDKNVPYVTAYLKHAREFSMFCFCPYFPYPWEGYKTIHCQKNFSRGLIITKTTRLSYFIANRPYQSQLSTTINSHWGCLRTSRVTLGWILEISCEFRLIFDKFSTLKTPKDPETAQ